MKSSFMKLNADEYVRFVDGYATLRSKIESGKDYLYVLVKEKKDKVMVSAREHINGKIERYHQIFETNGLPAKAKACAYCANLKGSFLAA